MKILIIGSGGREHALAWKFAQSEKVEKVFVALGNGGTVTEAKCENVPLSAETAEGREELKRFALGEKIDLTVIGPEAPLAEGVADILRDAGLAVIGPGRAAARLEASKIYSKDFMSRYGVRAAKSSSFTDPEKARAFATEHFNAGENVPLVVKADGLAAGKGVIITHNMTEAETALSSLMRDKTLGAAGTSVLLEEFLEGTEVSVLAAVSVTGGALPCPQPCTPVRQDRGSPLPGEGYIQPFIPARDHKSRFEGGQGPNTGGMGAIAPVPDFTKAAQEDFVRSILEPTLRGIKAEGFDYRGFIFFGLMVHADRCYLLEYNVRLGDPETQAVLPLMDFDMVDLCTAILSGKEFPLTWKPGAVCAPFAVADGYPGPYRKGDIITVDNNALEKTGAKVFISGAQLGNGERGTGTRDCNSDDGIASELHSNTSDENPQSPVPSPQSLLKTSGGRVLTVSAYGENAGEARANAYQGLAAVRFEGMGYRKDIGA